MKTIEPLVAGSARTILSSSLANQLVDGAKAIKGFRGGYGVSVTHSQEGIRVDLKNGTTFNELVLDGCPVPQVHLTDDGPFDYILALSGPGLRCPPVSNGPSDRVSTVSNYSENRVGASVIYDLIDYFPYSTFHDGVCGIFPRTGSAVYSYYPQTGLITGGTFTLTVTQGASSSTTAALNWTASDSDITNALNPLAVVAAHYPHTLTVTTAWAQSGTYNVAYKNIYVAWDGSYAPSGVNISGSGANLTNGAAQIIVVAQTNHQKQLEFRPLNRWRDHPNGSMTVGPFTVPMIVFAATAIKCDDVLTFSNDGAGEYTILADTSTPCPANTPLCYLPANTACRFRNLDSGGAYIWASGKIGVKPPKCIPPSWWARLGLTTDGTPIS